MNLSSFLKRWWSKHIVSVCPQELDDYFDYNPKKEGTLWKRNK